MFNNLHNVFHNVQLFFTNFITVLIVPIIIALSIASGYTTFHGMINFITPWIAFPVTFAVQAIIILAAFKLSRSYWKANRTRYLSYIVSLIIGLIISVYFSYFTFYEKSQSKFIKEVKFNALRTTIEDYIQEARKSKVEIILRKERNLELFSAQADSAELGRGSFLPDSLRGRTGRGGFYWSKKREERRQRMNLDVFKQDFEKIEAESDSFLANLDIDALRDRANYRLMLARFSKLSNKIQNMLSNYGYQVINQPELISYERFVELIPDFVVLRNISYFSLFLAVIIDVLAFVFSYRLSEMPTRLLSSEERRLAYLGIKEFSRYSINKRDQLELIIEKSSIEKADGYDDSARMFIAALLLNSELSKKVDADKVEFTPTFYPIIAQEFIKDLLSQKRDGNIDSSNKMKHHLVEGEGKNE